MKYSKNFLKLLTLYILIPAMIFPGEKKKKDQYEFTMVKQVKTTPVKNQARTGTCWSFATTSFVETELIRKGAGEFNLSTMWNVRFTYPQKAINYIRYNGLANFGEGGQAHDVINVIREHGFVPEEVYPGKHEDETEYDNGELDRVLKSIVEAVKRGRKITPVWPKVIDATLDTYLGTPPKEFTWEGKTYTPKQFAESLGFNPDDYVEISSYTHHPFYKQFDLEVPDNWSKDKYYNVPMDDLIGIINNALNNGYSVAWDGDVSEKEFEKKKDYAIIPADDENSSTDADKDENEDEQPIKEKTITQEMRQQTFNNHTTTDDHLMHIVGLAKDQTGEPFYYTKNSWGTKDKKYGGYWYLSLPYIQLKTIAIMVHKDAIPAELREKLGIKTQ